MISYAHGVPDSPQQLRFAVLGPLRAWFGGERVDLGPNLQQAVLAALLLSPDVTVSKEQLLARVWGDEPPRTGAKGVPGYVYRLRTHLQAAGVDAQSVISGRGSYRFISNGVWLDFVRLNEMVAEAAAARQGGDLVAAVDAYSSALALFDGEPLAGLSGPFILGQRERLTQRRIALTQEKLDWQIRLGRYTDAIDELSGLTAAHPYNETLATLLMRAYYGSGRQGDALNVREELRGRLVEKYGTDPGAEVRRVHEAILREDDASLGIAPRQELLDRRPRDELPIDVGELAGRERELELLTAPVGAGAVTVAAVDGVAGAGKTALVVRAAQAFREQCPDGRLFVDLHAHSEKAAALDSQRALRRLLRAVGVLDTTMPDDLDELAASWRAATAALRLVLVLDDAVGAEQVRPLLPAGAGSVVLVTSRRRLTGLDVDRRASLGPLELDEAAGLLNRIVGAPRADREPDRVREVARLCGRLPLALRIAGARLQNRPQWTFKDLVSRLTDGESLLGELTAEDRSVEAAFRLSYDQLPSAEQRAFRMLGLSPTAELDRLALAAMLSCSPGEAERLLENLVDASLVQQPAVGRYRMHDLVAVYAQQLAGEEPAEVITAARTAVFRLYVAAGRYTSEWGALAFPTGPDLAAVPFTGWDDAAAWLDTAGDLADVVSYAVAKGYLNYACWIAECVVDYLVRQSRYHECRTAIEIARSVARLATDQRMVSSLRVCVGFACVMQGHFEQARTLFAEALQISRDTGNRRDATRASGGLALLAMNFKSPSEAFAELTEVLLMVRELEDDWLAEWITSSLGYLHHAQGRHDEALDYITQARVLAEKIGSPAILGRTLCYLGSIHLEVGRPAEAVGPLRQAAKLAEQVNDVLLHASCLSRLGTAEQELGNPDTALELHHRTLARITDQIAVVAQLEIRNRFGFTLLAAGQVGKAREQFELALALPDVTGNSAERARALDGLGRCES
jgi:DNA-binding SARP family transcriptional activator/Tfp pilus assembly protein PilF